MAFPARWTIQRLPHESGATDAHGNPVDGYGPPEDVRVYGWGSPQSTEPKLAGHDRVVVDLEVLMPAPCPFDDADRAVVNGHTYSVVGEPEDYNHGPFGWEPGYVVNLRRVED